MGRQRKFTKEQEYQIMEDYLDTPPGYGFSKIARRWKCSETTIANVYKRVLKDMKGEQAWENKQT